MSELRAVHVVKAGTWRLNWRLGRYRWAWDFNRWGSTIVTPFAYVSIGKVQLKQTGSCEDDCQEACAYPGQFAECEIGATDA